MRLQFSSASLTFAHEPNENYLEKVEEMTSQ